MVLYSCFYKFLNVNYKYRSQIQLNGIWFPQDIVNEDKNKVKRFTFENNNYKTKCTYSYVLSSSIYSSHHSSFEQNQKWTKIHQFFRLNVLDPSIIAIATTMNLRKKITYETKEYKRVDKARLTVPKHFNSALLFPS